MNALLDTNIVVRHVNRNDVLHPAVEATLAGLLAQGAKLVLAAQSLYEYWVVATRPVEVNGLGLAAAEARQTVDALLESFELLADPADLVHRWLDLCTRFAVRGRPAHDARLIAAMQGNGISHLVTLDPGDFARYPGIECIIPR